MARGSTFEGGPVPDICRRSCAVWYEDTHFCRLDSITAFRLLMLVNRVKRLLSDDPSVLQPAAGDDTQEMTIIKRLINSGEMAGIDEKGDLFQYPASGAMIDAFFKSATVIRARSSKLEISMRDLRRWAR